MDVAKEQVSLPSDMQYGNEIVTMHRMSNPELKARAADAMERCAFQLAHAYICAQTTSLHHRIRLSKASNSVHTSNISRSSVAACFDSRCCFRWR